MARRTKKEIEKDYEKIRVVVDITPVTSLWDIAEQLGLSVFAVKTSLSKHPRIAKKIMEKLEKNKEKLEAEKEDKREADNKTVLESEKKDNQDVNNKTVPESEEKEIQEVNQEVSPSEGASDFEKGFVLDASICGIENLDFILSNLCSGNSRIILTSVTIKELEKLQKFNDRDAMDARHILAMAAENQNSFHNVLIDEDLETPDDCIIKYCADNKDRVALLTSDKSMVLKSRMYGVKTEYYKQRKNPNTDTPQPQAYTHNNNNTLSVVKKIGKKLFISDFNSRGKSIYLISNGVVYTDGLREVKIGDEVYQAKKQDNFIMFNHYKIISLSAENNCKLIYTRRIYKTTDILFLPNEEYKNFLYDFKRRHDS